MRPIFTFLFLCFTIVLAQAQRIDIKASVVDSNAAPLTGATVLLTNAIDSSLAGYAITDATGTFQIKRVVKDTYYIQISYVGFNPLIIDLAWPDSDVLDLGTIKLYPVSKNLQTVEVEAARIPLQFKNDTIEYNADAFKVQPNAVVEDLLKRLPGVEVEEDGTIKAQGETVNKLLVDGKEFFGDDPKLASKNLPADAVEKVQVFDKKSDQAEFSGIDDGQDVKAINLQLKEDKKKGIFGNLMAGHGDQGRFQSKASINKFSPKQQISFIGLGNNINEKGFSVGDYINLMGGMKGLAGGSLKLEFNSANDLGIPLNFGDNDGFITTWSGGINFNQDISDKTSLNLNYFYSNIHNDILQTTDQTNFFENLTLNSITETQQDSRNRNNRLALILDHEINKKQSLKFTTNATFGDTETAVNSINTQNGQEKALNTSNERINRYTQDQFNLNSSLLYRLKFNKKGRTFSSNLTFNLGETDLDGDLRSLNSFFDTNQGLNQTDTIQQRNDQINEQSGFGLKLSYTEPLAKRLYGEISAEARYSNDDFNRQVFDNLESNEVFNEQLSNQYDNQTSFYRAGFNTKYVRKNFNLSAGLNYQQTNLDGIFPLLNTEVERSFFNWLPSLFANFEFANNKKLGINYRTNINVPDIQQLQPIVDNTNPFNIYQGNPNLKPEYRHNLAANFFLFDQFSFTSLFLNTEFTYTKNKIRNAQSIDEFLVRTTMPMNVADDYDLRQMLSFSTRFKPLDITLNINTSVDYNRGFTFIEAQENLTNRVTWSNRLRFTNRKKNLWDWTLGGRVSYTNTSYSISDDFNQNYFNQTYFADLGFEFLKSWRFQTNFDYEIYSALEGQNGNTPGRQDVPIWKASISKFLFEDKRAELKLAVIDILNRNRGINRFTDLNFYQETRINTLGRYFMMSFVYQLKGFGSGNSVDVKFGR